jgi:hypothetical protein
MPSKLKATHVCSGPGRSVAGIVIPFVKWLIPKERRMRVLHHAGFWSTVLESCSDYGLGEDSMGVVYDSYETRLKIAQEWLADMRLSES